MDKILQIIPADGWYAQYRDKKDGLFAEPIICFALVEDDKDEFRSVVGMIDGGEECGYIEVCSDVSNFTGYTRSPETKLNCDQ